MSALLFLSRWQPYPANNGSKLRIYNLLRGLAEQYTVDLISFYDPAVEEPVPGELANFCRDVTFVPYKPFDPRSRQARAGFLSLEPRSVRDTFSAELAATIESAVVAHNYVAVVASQFDMAVYRPFFAHIPALFEEVEVGVLYEQFAQATGLNQRLRHGLTWWKHRRYLRRLLDSFDGCTVVSAQEKTLLGRQVPNQHTPVVIPNCIDLAAYADVKETAAPGQIIFTGALAYKPNYESMVWFLSDVFPQLLADFPEAHLLITGRRVELPLPTKMNVTLTSLVEDIRPFVAQSAVSIAPIWQGGGTRLKILEAMALRVPVVSTTKGAEGLDVAHGRHLLLADTAETFKTAVATLLRDNDLRQRLAAEAFALVKEKYDWQVVLPGLRQEIERISNQAAV
jgi:glycosyltransferase involved in cell wall biosynthesis